MKTLVTNNEYYSIYTVGSEYLYEIAKFIVEQNYKRHTGKDMDGQVEDEIKSIYEEELSLAKNSQIFIVETNDRIIGCIRVTKWDEKSLLPVQKIFNIDPLNSIRYSKQSTFWHIGRLAVDSSANVSTVSLFKKLMMYAIYPIYQETDGYMIAEVDSKLLRVINRLGMDTVRLGDGTVYLGSETIPVYADKKGLNKFYQSYISEIVIDEIITVYKKAA